MQLGRAGRHLINCVFMWVLPGSSCRRWYSGDLFFNFLLKENRLGKLRISVLHSICI
jgi:hypothetical protein